MQVAKLDMTNTTHQCPPGTRLRIHSAKRLCENTRSGSGCSSTIFDVHGIEYRQVCGKIIAYQYGSPDAFVAFNKITRSNNVDDNYLDGISLTHGRSPRKHIWTFVGANDESGIFPGAPVTRGFCSCTNTSRQKQVSQPPSFVGDDYFCDTGSEEEWQNILYPDDPLWDGAGCGPANTCCSLNSPPWFLKQLPSSTTDNIEMRICRDEDSDNEDIKVETIELYIR